MKISSLASSPTQARQTKHQFARSEDYLSYELGKAVQELPPLYTRLLSGSISLLVFGAITWASLSKIDEVAVAPGDLIASTQVRPVRSLGEGTVTDIKIKEGDRVKKGDVLIERNSDLPQAEVDRLARSARLIREDLSRLESERSGSGTGGTTLQSQLLTSRLKDFESRKAAAVAEANSKLSAMNEAKVRISRLQENLINSRTSLVNARTNLVNAQSIVDKAKGLLANAEKREQGLRSLIADGAVPRLDYIEAQNGVIQAQAGVTTAEDSITNGQNKITEAQDRVTSIEKEIAAQAKQLPVLALNTPTEVTRQVARGGLESLTPKQRKFIPPFSEIRTDNDQYRQMMLNFFQRHQHGDHGSSKSFNKFFLAQVLWDETMAEKITQFLQANPDYQVVVLVGQGHIVYGHGIPSRVSRRMRDKNLVQRSVLLSPSSDDLANNNQPIADLVWE